MVSNTRRDEIMILFMNNLFSRSLKDPKTVKKPV